ncbi:MAG: dTDP-4-amino-4,6-dideoxygalactose transaminase [Stenotrophomonas nitritireducens]|uniref:dTDP-4-amino-4,6-dideoxygalactose transaminase n=1 Tax=Stenotrophomonas nitritireducens TaxID=83617 RepID=UPI001AD09E34|nr:dTDP-4-amino-4,6-dideoxygalactose transaminase [Stenotrophomonas nitritireducens]MBN8793563.1 dTDP-4-amino-4,6-dideoxygalactose transaminase [Stenotrophomonas nitritireducens]MBN8797134.1 dTDP-4-amino-4,6-dideoxygalactose transaminase [Stenotrophomonas nitritireducens]
MIPFNKPYMTGRELSYIAQAHANGHLSGDGKFTKECHAWLKQHTLAHHALLTHSCTAALEMAALLLDLRAGDEVIMPSYTFVSTANAFALRGAIPVFVDIREDTLNIDERLIEAAITPRTKAICVVHYAGVACEMDTIMDIAQRHGLAVVEDAAQAIYSKYKGRPLGGIGNYGALSFHETKNLISGEGGALLVRDPHEGLRAEILREKGTNRSQFFRGQVDKYTWVDLGSSYLPSELVAAFLKAQIEEGESINAQRLAIWDRYHTWAEGHERAGRLRRPVVPAECEHNAHMYYLLLTDLEARTEFIARMKNSGIGAVFHYVPLHTSPAGQKLGRAHEELDNTVALSERLVRLPLWVGVDAHLEEILDAADRALAGLEA